MKISVLFKPSTKSWVASDLTYAWYYEIEYNKLKSEDYTKLKKVLLTSVPYDKLRELYTNCNRYFNENAVVILATSINNLFE